MKPERPSIRKHLCVEKLPSYSQVPALVIDSLMASGASFHHM